jgi:hypothetical protein
MEGTMLLLSLGPQLSPEEGREGSHFLDVGVWSYSADANRLADRREEKDLAKHIQRYRRSR